MRAGVLIILFLLLTVALIYLCSRLFEYASIYHPIREIDITPDQLQIESEEHYFSTPDGVVLHGWHLYNQTKNTNAPIVIFCHGNGGNISHRLEKAKVLTHIGFDVFLFDYRGYGRSEGRPSETGLYRDAKTSYDYVLNVIKKSKDGILLYGESLGGAVAIDLVSKIGVDAIIVEDTFTSIKDMTKVLYPWIPTFLLHAKYDSLSKISEINSPIYIFHSKDDDIIPFKLGQDLYNSATSQKKFITLQGPHNSAYWDSKEIWISSLEEIFKNVTANSRQ